MSGFCGSLGHLFMGISNLKSEAKVRFGGNLQKLHFKMGFTMEWLMYDILLKYLTRGAHRGLTERKTRRYTIPVLVPEVVGAKGPANLRGRSLQGKTYNPARQAGAGHSAWGQESAREADLGSHTNSRCRTGAPASGRDSGPRCGFLKKGTSKLEQESPIWEKELVISHLENQRGCWGISTWRYQLGDWTRRRARWLLATKAGPVCENWRSSWEQGSRNSLSRARRKRNSDSHTVHLCLSHCVSDHFWLHETVRAWITVAEERCFHTCCKNKQHFSLPFLSSPEFFAKEMPSAARGPRHGGHAKNWCHRSFIRAQQGWTSDAGSGKVNKIRNFEPQRQPSRKLLLKNLGFWGECIQNSESAHECRFKEN